MRHLLLLLLLTGLSPAALGQAQVYVAVGDSITFGTGDESTGAKGYPPRLETLLRNAGRTATVRNEGVPGENTDEALLTINTILSRGGDVMLLMEGTNDISQQYSPVETLFNLNAIAGRAESRGWQVIQATLIPRSQRARVDADNIVNQSMNQRFRDLAGFNGRNVADVYEVLGQQTNLFARFYDLDPTDSVGHLNAAGYDLMARIFFDAITGNDTVPPVFGDTSPRPGNTGVPGNRAIEVDVWDFGTGVNAANTRLLINGAEVTTTSEGSGRLVTLVHSPPTPLTGVVRVGLRSRDNATTANTVDRDVFRFVVLGTRFVDGDFDRDGRVDGRDLVQLARAFGARIGDNVFRFAYDLNDDNVIDGGDLAIVAANFGRTAS